MTLTLSGRLQTRLLLAVTVGVAWTIAITPVLPRPTGVGLSAAYRMTFASLGLMAAAGVAWEFIYHALQQLRWDKDWPSLFALLAVLNEGGATWLLVHAAHIVPGSIALSSPALPLFLWHFTTAYLMMWLFMQGPLRVFHVRWRLEGGRFLRTGRPNQEASVPSSYAASAASAAWVDSGDQLPDNTVMAPATARLPVMVDGIVCAADHVNHPDARYCATCGCSLLGAGRTKRRLPRPALGVLVSDTGATCILDKDMYCISSPDGVRFEDAGTRDRATGSDRLEIRLAGWQCLAVSTGSHLSISLPDGRSILLEPHAPVPLPPGSEVVMGEHRVLYESPHHTSVRSAYLRDENDPDARPDPEDDTIRRIGNGRVTAAAGLLRRAAALTVHLAVAAAVIIALHIVFAAFRANPRNSIVLVVGDLSAKLAVGFRDLFTSADTGMRMVVDYGLAAVAYLVAAKVAENWIRRREENRDRTGASDLREQGTG